MSDHENQTDANYHPNEPIPQASAVDHAEPARLSDLQIGFVRRHLDRVTGFVSGPAPAGDVDAVTHWCQAQGAATLDDLAQRWCDAVVDLGMALAKVGL